LNIGIAQEANVSYFGRTQDICGHALKDSVQAPRAFGTNY